MNRGQKGSSSGCWGRKIPKKVFFRRTAVLAKGKKKPRTEGGKEKTAPLCGEKGGRRERKKRGGSPPIFFPVVN